MVNKCCVIGCKTNNNNEEKGPVFSLPKNEDCKQKWLKFINRKDCDSLKNIFVCYKHFKDKFLNINDERVTLLRKDNPVPTLRADGSCEPHCSSAVLESITQPRKLPRSRPFREDEYARFKKEDAITSLSDITEPWLNVTFGEKFRMETSNSRTIIYKIDKNMHEIPEITHCISISADLRVKLFYKSSPMPLPSWFREGRNTILDSKGMLHNFISYMDNVAESKNSIADELQQINYYKNPMYSARLIRFALQLRYTSLAAYKMMSEEFKLPAISRLRQIVQGQVDSVSVVKALKESGCISEDVILLFDEMYLQKSEEYSGGKTTGTNEDGELYKGVVCFMIIGTKSNTPYVIHSAPEIRIDGSWIKSELLKCMEVLENSGFVIRGVVCDNHASNVAAYKFLLKEDEKEPNDLAIVRNGKKVYLFHDSVHLMKNIRNNLLNNKRLIFPPFSCNLLSEKIEVSGGEMSWKLLHDIHDEDRRVQANLRAAPKLTAQVLHPGNCKQNVSVALAIFEETTIAALKRYFPSRNDAAQFLHAFHVWWSISNSKQRFNSRNSIGNAAVLGDRKPEFLRLFADWIAHWTIQRLPNSQKFTLTAQTSAALIRTMRCQAALIEDLLRDDYDFVLTARFQSDPLERRFGQYRQMSGGRFLVSAKNVEQSEKILKIKALIDEGFDFTPEFKSADCSHDEVELFLTAVEHRISCVDSLCLSPESREVSDHVAGYIVAKVEEKCGTCCMEELEKKGNSSSKAYIGLLSRGGLRIPSAPVSECVAEAFSLLDLCSDDVRKSGLSSRQAGKLILETHLQHLEIACPKHVGMVQQRIVSSTINCFFNNQRKRKTDSIVHDRIVEFKKSKRDKNF